MINKKLVHFNSKTAFEEQKDAGNILETSIVFVKDSNEIYTHDTEYRWVGWSYLTADIPEGYVLFNVTDGSFKDANGEYLIVEE